MSRRAIIDGGTFYHAEALHGARYRGRFGEVLYAPELTAEQLSGVSLLVVPDRTAPAILRAKRPLLLDLLDRGGTLVVFAETGAAAWAPNVAWRFTPVNFWWWRQDEAPPPVTLAAPDHALFRHVTLADCVWHHHGHFATPPGATPLVTLGAAEDAPSLLYEDRVSSRGRLILATLDPFYHHGSHFMPAATRFLDGFARWVEEERGT